MRDTPEYYTLWWGGELRGKNIQERWRWGGFFVPPWRNCLNSKSICTFIQKERPFSQGSIATTNIRLGFDRRMATMRLLD